MQLQRPASVTPAFSESSLMLNRHQLAISSFGGRRLGRLLAIAAIESVNAPGRVEQVLLAGRARLETFAAGAGYCDFLKFWMNSRFHFSSTYYSCQILVSINQL